MAVFTHDAAHKFYNRFGARQDRQGWYENPALDVLLAEGKFPAARAVCEFGVGTGALMARMLEGHLPADATGLGLDISEQMITLAKDRLAPWAGRVKLVRTAGRPVIPAADGSFDRVVSSYVLDLLTDDDIVLFLAEAGRVLGPDGLLCLAGLTPGPGGLSRVTGWLWRQVHSVRPALVGGCRPIKLAQYLTACGWRVRFRKVVTPYGIASEIIIASSG